MFTKKVHEKKPTKKFTKKFKIKKKLKTFVVRPVRPSFKSPSTNSAILQSALVTPDGDPETETILSISLSFPFILTSHPDSSRICVIFDPFRPIIVPT